MNKFLIYTSNLGFTPKNLEEIVKFAKAHAKFYIANVELNAHLANVKAGDNIITKKGNSLYIIKALSDSLENLSQEDRDYLDTLTREYNLKKCNITSVANTIKFGTWCKTASPLVNNNPTNNTEKKMKSNSLKNLGSRIESMFMPVKATDVRIATDGNICVETANGFVAIDANNNLASYPEEFTLALPVYIMSKPKEQLAVGDIIATDRSYAKVTKIDGDKLSAISYTGTGRCIHLIKDILFNQTMVRVVVSMAGNLGGGTFNPIMLALLSKEGGDDKMSSLLPLMMMSQQNGAVSMNPMMMAFALGDGKDSSLKDLMLMSAFTGGANPFANMFAAPAQAQAPAAEAPKADAAAENENV